MPGGFRFATETCVSFHPRIQVCTIFFSKVYFVVHKTTKLFSAIIFDHAHEQENANIKGKGGAVGLTENPSALKRWMVAGPELSRMIQEF